MQTTARSLPEFLHSALFQTVSVRGFHWMRRVWVLLTFAIFLAQWQDVSLYYGEELFLPYLLLLLTLPFVLVGVGTRPALIVSALLFTFFLRRNHLPFGGGELFLHHLGLLLMVTPEKEGRMPIWPYRLLLFQIVVLYCSSAWQKLLGEMWWDGTALAIALQHPHFARWPDIAVNMPSWLSLSLAWVIIAWELVWLLLLVPRKFLSRMLGLSSVSTRHFFLLSGVAFHFLILLFLKVGSFSPAVLAGYLGVFLVDPPSRLTGRVDDP